MNVCTLCGKTAAMGVQYCTQPRCYETAIARLKVSLASAEGLRDKYAQEALDSRATIRKLTAAGEQVDSMVRSSQVLSRGSALDTALKAIRPGHEEATPPAVDDVPQEWKDSRILPSDPEPAPVKWSSQNIAHIDGVNVTSDREGEEWEVAIYCCLRFCTKEKLATGPDRDVLARQIAAEYLADEQAKKKGVA